MNVWDLIIQQPMINILIMMSYYLANSLGLAIIALTVIINVLLIPLTLKQTRSSKAMQELQPKMAELQKKYGKDKQRLAQEQMRLYKESGMNPAGCLGPMVIQMPIWIALYQAVMMCLAVAPEGLLNLSRYLYSWPIVYSILPLGSNFLWLDLAEPDMFLALLVGATMWLQQKMVTPISNDPRQRSQSQMMLWMMPLMFTFLCLSFPSGLALFWVASSIVRIIIQYYVTGWGGLVATTTAQPTGRVQSYKRRIAPVERKPQKGADIIAPPASKPEELGYGKSGNKRLRGIRRQSKEEKDQNPK